MTSEPSEVVSGLNWWKTALPIGACKAPLSLCLYIYIYICTCICIYTHPLNPPLEKQLHVPRRPCARRTHVRAHATEVWV